MSATLDGAEFSRALAAGLGRALRDARTVPVDVRRECLVEACARHQAWDPQLSSNRGRWLARVLEASGDMEALAPRLLEELAAMPDDYEHHHDATQLVELTAALAKRRIPGAREALYAAHAREDSHANHVACLGIVELDRLSGCEWIARTLGARMRADANFEPDEWMVSCSRDEIGELEFDAWLERTAVVDEDVAAFRRCVLRQLAEQAEREREKPEVRRDAARPGEENAFWWNFRFADAHRRLLESPHEGQYFYWMSRWARTRANEQDLEDMYGALLTDEDPRVLGGCLRALERGVPLRFDPRLLRLLEHENDRVNHYAHNALSRITDERVRSVAVGRLRGGKCDGDTLMLLRENFAPGDADLIRQTLPIRGEQWQTHDIASDLLDLLKAHGSREETDLLEWCFDWAACENCRGSAVELLLEHSALSPVLAEEARYDADIYVRELVARCPVPIDAPLPPE